VWVCRFDAKARVVEVANERLRIEVWAAPET
jgi:hypothetical protein